MKKHSIVITDRDIERLSYLIRGAQHSVFRDQQQLDMLDHILQNADVRPLHSTPKSVVRLRSKVRVRDIETGKEDVYTLVFPGEANASLGLISVLAPIGIALIGRRKGASAEALVPGRIRKLRILQVAHGPTSSSENELPARRPVTLSSPISQECLVA